MASFRLRPILATTSVAAAATAAAFTLYVAAPRTVYAESPAKKIFPGVGPALLSLPLESSELVNHDTKRLRFKLPDDQGSTHLHSLSPGDALLFAAVLPGPRWTPNEHEHVALVAGGAGVTPCFQLLRGILLNPDDRTRCTLVVGVNAEGDVLLAEELGELQARFPGRLRTVVTVSRPTRNNKNDNAGYREGYVTKELLDEVFAGDGEKESGGRGGVTKVFVCGPPGMERALVGSKSAPGILEQAGFKKSQIQKF
ncbi:hypothetical protein N3K66_007424 [Trichothecium roseum]|uniref:Uncharacterized protein n=1 Tax=Trichothecium roseum TaxID=47278 RepID=A0ACC0UU13_9HYPO|nr:hypothetical protein N3K66_007424 [Trichothecium roseum]